MKDFSLSEKVQKVIHFMSDKEFESVTQNAPYFHMGATITDSILQSGINYRNVVYPRVKKILLNYPNFRTTCDFIILFQSIPLNQIIDWNGTRKVDLIKKLSWYFYNESIQNENDLSKWLNNSENIRKLLEINGIGNKTVDYLKILTGQQSVAIDRHLFKFLELAGITARKYEEAESVYKETAKILNYSLYELDRKIWIYMSNQNLN